MKGNVLDITVTSVSHAPPQVALPVAWPNVVNRENSLPKIVEAERDSDVRATRKTKKENEKKIK